MYYKGAVLYYSGPDVVLQTFCVTGGPRCITRDEQYRGHDVLKWMFCITNVQYSITRDFVLITGDVMNYKGCFIFAGDFVYYVIN